MKTLRQNVVGFFILELSTTQNLLWLPLVYYSLLERMVLIDYRFGRSREGPQKLLKNFKGYLQTDDYTVYDLFANNKSITHLNCMAHALVAFEKALKYDKFNTEYAMDMLQ